MNPVQNVLSVLLVEDDPGDILMAQEAIAEQPVRSDLHIARDGVEAMDYLRGSTSGGATPTPDLVLLDLNLPRMDGREVLAEIRSDARLTHLPVVVLTTSSSEDDVLTSYRLHANAYVTKPSDFTQFTRTVRDIGRFFSEIARLPRPSAV
jgi:CheY-like chemotaxis protein